MVALFALSLISGFVAGMAAYVVAYEHAFMSAGRREARRIAWRAVPGPAGYFMGLGLVLSFLLPFLADRR